MSSRSSSKLITRHKLKFQPPSHSPFPNQQRKTKHPKRKPEPPSIAPHQFLSHLKSIPDPIVALSHLLSSPPSLLDYPSCSSLIYRLSRGPGFVPILLPFLSYIHSQRVPLKEPLFSTLINNLGKLGLPDIAVRVFESISSFNVAVNCPSKMSLNFLINALVENGRVDHARNVLNSCPKLGIRSNVVSYNIIIKGYCKSGDLDGARQVLDEMVERRNIRPSVVTFNILIGHVCKENGVGSAIKLKDEMLLRWRVVPNAVTFALLMKGLCEEGKYGAARRLMFDMEFQNCKTSLVNYGVLINDCAKRGDSKGIEELLSEMKKRRVKPDDAIYNIIISFTCREGRVHEAYRIILEMQIKGGCDPSAATYRSLLDGCCMFNEFDLGFRVLNAMLASSHVPRSESFVCLIKGLCENAKLDEACVVLDETVKRGNICTDLETWNALVETNFCQLR
ncbi:Pentatricopeptide repeat-containing protein [Rhynchospora pubera]|uniref:Pentatricopeptide repeat-containing protein n=1 Tax=Rhynchospora pubera TaxID=906938 RepID=A0AAV8FUI1_9POAL|nr:Pentatricopeptide repeat-containing protein [Rhynchospora pubera]